MDVERTNPTPKGWSARPGLKISVNQQQPRRQQRHGWVGLQAHCSTNSLFASGPENVGFKVPL